jgi:hypothetical protein
LPVAEFEVVEDVEGILLTASDLDRLTYALRELPMKLRTLGEQAYHAGYLAAIRVEPPVMGASFFGNAVAEIVTSSLYRATHGLTTDEREQPYATGLR